MATFFRASVSAQVSAPVSLEDVVGSPLLDQP